MNRIILALCLAASACASAPVPEGPGERPLAYAGADAPLVYEFADSTRMTIEAGPMGAMRVLAAQAGTAEITFEESGAVIRSVLRLLDFDGRFENPNQGAARADESDITGAWTVILDPRGRIEVTDTPSLTDRGRTIIGGESFVRPFFVHLPAAAVTPGARWVDTVSVVERTPEAETRARSIVVSTLRGDTVIEGRTLAVIETEAETTMEVEGASGGVEILQRLSGGTQGIILWDRARSILFDRREQGELEGTLELPGVGFGGLPVAATVRRTVTLRP